MADNTISITINARTGDMSGVQAIEQRLSQMRRSLGATPGGSAGLNIALNLVPGSTAGLQALAQQTAQQMSLRIAQGLTPGAHAGILRATGFETLAGPYGGIRRVGYQGTADLPSVRQAMETPPFVPPRPLVPMPPAPPRLSTIERLGLIPRGPGGPPVPPGSPPVPPQEEQPERGPSWGQRAGTAAAAAAGGMARGALPWLRAAGPAAVGVAVGLKAYDIASQGMEAYRQRAQGILDVTRRLNLAFEDTASTIDLVRQGYYVLTRDSLQAIGVMGRITGRLAPGAVAAALGTGSAYGLAPVHAAGLAGTLAMRAGSAGEPLARALAGARAAYGRGGLPMAVEPLLEETTRIAGYGGAAAVPMGAGYYGAWAGLIGGLGQRYREPGQTADTYGRIAAGVTNAPDPTTMALRMRAIGDLHRKRLARGLGHNMTFGEGEGKVIVDLRTLEGRRIAMEQAINSPEVLQQYWESAREQFGTTGDQAALAFEQIFLGGAAGPTEARRLRQRFERGGGPTGLLRPGNVPAELATEAARRQTIEQRPEFKVTELVEALAQAPLERLGKPLVEASTELRLGLIRTAEALEQVQWRDVVKAVQDLPGQLLAALRQLPMLPGLSGSPLWGGGGGVEGFSFLPGGGDPFTTVPQRPGPSLLPQQSRP